MLILVTEKSSSESEFNVLLEKGKDGPGRDSMQLFWRELLLCNWAQKSFNGLHLLILRLTGWFVCVYTDWDKSKSTDKFK